MKTTIVFHYTCIFTIQIYGIVYIHTKLLTYAYTSGYETRITFVRTTCETAVLRLSQAKTSTKRRTLALDAHKVEA